MGSDDDGSRKVKPSSTCEWTPDAVHCLLEHYGEKYAVGRGCLRNKDWEELVNSVNALCDGQSRPKTLKQCRDKVDSLKKRYKMEKNRVMTMGMPASTWPFFAKLDEIISSVPKASIPLGLPANQVKWTDDQHVGYGTSPAERQHNNTSNGKGDEPSASGSSSTNSAVRGSAQDSSERKGKTSLESVSEPSSEGEKDAPSSSEKIQEPVEDGGCLRKLEQFSESMLKLLAEKRRRTSSNPMQAMADAVIGFSDVYARIELAKLDIYTSMQLEIAKLERKRKRRTRKSTTSTSSGSQSR